LNRKERDPVVRYTGAQTIRYLCRRLAFTVRRLGFAFRSSAYLLIGLEPSEWMSRRTLHDPFHPSGNIGHFITQE
jgi:hypothetical protein